jgi:dihydrofolate reductase
MPSEFRVFIATSLDGFIARLDGSLDWLDQEPAPEHDFGYGEFLASVDALLMGRKTFETVAAFEPWPFPAHPVTVLSSTLKPSDLSTALASAVQIHNGTIAALVEKLSSARPAIYYVDGGQLIQGFLKEKLISEMIITRVPVLLGSGIPLFSNESASLDSWWDHLRTDSFDNGFTQSQYRIRRPSM